MDQVTTSTRPRVRVRIDLNARNASGLVPTRASRADGYMAVGDLVVAYEPDDEVAAPARVAQVDDKFVYLDVDWSALADDVVVPHAVTIPTAATPSDQRTTGSLTSWLRVGGFRSQLVAGAAVLAAVVPGVANTVSNVVVPSRVSAAEADQTEDVQQT